MKYTQEATHFTCEGETLLGILAKPETPAETGVVVVVGGPQYRVGSHRQFVLLSRALASAGYAVLRFDYRGMGDSTGEKRDFQSVSSDIKAAIDALQACIPKVNQVALWGLCDGASASLLYCDATHDPRVRSLCLLNPWVRSETGLAKTQVKHYYARRLRQKEFWIKLISGRMGLSALGGFAKRVWMTASSSQLPEQKATFQHRMFGGLDSFSGRTLFILSAEDFTAKEFVEYTNHSDAWRNCLKGTNLLRQEIPGVDHTFSSAYSRKIAEDLTLHWLEEHTGKIIPALTLADN